jgi:hypothetical protein
MIATAIMLNGVGEDAASACAAIDVAAPTAG